MPLVPFVPLVVAQAAALTVPLDVSKVLYAGFAALFGLMTAALGWFLKRYVAHQDRSNAAVKASVLALGQKVDHGARETQAIRQELVGIDGRNGMKSVQRRQTRQIEKLTVTVALLAQDRGIDLPPDAEDDG